MNVTQQIAVGVAVALISGAIVYFITRPPPAPPPPPPPMQPRERSARSGVGDAVGTIKSLVEIGVDAYTSVNAAGSK